MNTRPLVYGAVSAFAALSAITGGAAASRPVPRPAMAERLAKDIDVIGIVHWGLNTYTDREWGFGDEDPALLNPPKFDADQIVEACKAGGIGGLVVVAKHHDGFCLWPTKTTEHNITKTPFWRGTGNGEWGTGRDYVKEMEQACRRHGLKFGVYCSPWDRNSAHYATDKYVEIYHAQLKELLGGAYGDIFEMWFDGANGGDGWYGGANERRKIKPGYYRFDEVVRFVRELQPGVTIFAGELDDSDLRWPGNERGFIDADSRATTIATGGLSDGKFGNPGYVPQRNVGTPGGEFFRMCEGDFPLRKGWFYHEGERGTTKSGAYLAKLYVGTVGNGGTMDIGVAPTKDGRLCEEDVKALRGFKAMKDALFAHEAKPGGPFNVVMMREDLSRGEQVDAWEFVADGRAILRGKSIGNKRIRLLDKPVSAKRCEVRVLKDGGALQGVSFRLYLADPELVRIILSATTESGETDTAKWMTAAAAAVQEARTFYLRPGAAEGDGTKTSPFGSFAVAREAVRKAVSGASAAPGPVEVVVLDGSYFVDRPVRFTKEDSGTAAHPVVWRAQTRGGVRFTGGIPVPKAARLSPNDPAWARIPKEARTQVLVADLKAAGILDYGEVKASGVGGPYMELVTGGRFQTLARWPNDGWTGVARTEEQKKDENGKIIPSPSFSYLDDRVSRWADEPAPYGNGFFRHNWHADRVAFERIDPETKTVFQKGRGSVYGYSAKGFWFGYNLLCELDAPGEYYIDRERGRLYFWPEEKGAAAGGELTATGNMFIFAAVSNVAFDGFRIENCRNRAVTMSDCTDIRIAACSFANAGETAVEVSRSRDCRIAGCDIAWCGSGGVSVDGGDGKTLSHGNIVVENCHIHHFALGNLTYAPAVNVRGCGNAVRHCTIHDAPHVALLFRGREHEFLRNEIHSVCLESGEMGAIYCGRDWTLCGNRIEANYIHDIYAPRNQPNRGIMLDDGCGGITVTSNVFVRVGEGISLAAIGNVIENNLFVSNFPPIAAWANFADPEYFRNPYWAGGKDMLRLGGLPVHEEPWKTKYPYLGLLDDAIRTGTLRDPATRSVLRRNMSVGGTTNLVQFMDSRLPKSYGSRCAYTPKGWLVEDNSVDASAPPQGFRKLPPLSQIGVYKSSERVTWPISHPVTIKCSDLVYRNRKAR